MNLVYSAPKGVHVGRHTFCPGCTHSTAVKVIARVLDKNDWLGDAIVCLSVGCGMQSAGYFEIDSIQSAHGRAAATAVGAKRMSPKNLIFTYQGDGAASAIGFLETFSAANRGEPITAIMINNQIYGMTGGQTSPTTLLGQKTVTTYQGGRDAAREGYPVHMAEILGGLEAPGYVARVSLHTPKNILHAEKVIEKAFRLQIEESKYSFVEILSTCPTNWGIHPRKAPEYVEKYVLPEFPLGEFKKSDEKGVKSC